MVITVTAAPKEDVSYATSDDVKDLNDRLDALEGAINNSDKDSGSGCNGSVADTAITLAITLPVLIVVCFVIPRLRKKEDK